MIEHPSVSAVGSHLDEMFSPDHGRSGQEARPEGGPMEHLTRVMRELRSTLSEADINTEEAMHLGR